MARNKRPKAVNTAVDLLGTAFGINTQILRRSKSAESIVRQPTPYLINGVPVTSPQPLTYSTPLLQTGFLPFPQAPQPGMMQMAQLSVFPQAPQFPSNQTFMPNHLQYNPQPLQNQHHMPQEPTRYRVEPSVPPTRKDFEELVRINDHYNTKGDDEKSYKRISSASIASKEEEVVPKTTITIAKHICANCGRIRSRKYHHEHPIKPGETPIPAFCRKCQRDASSTSSEERLKDTRKSNKSITEQEKNVRAAANIYIYIHH